METKAECLVCKKTHQEVPLLALNFRGDAYWICPQHLPILIHHPEKLVGLLPGAENLEGHEN